MERLQRLLDRNPADAERLGELLLGPEQRPRWIRAGVDARLQDVDDLVVERDRRRRFDRSAVRHQPCRTWPVCLPTHRHGAMLLPSIIRRVRCYCPLADCTAYTGAHDGVDAVGRAPG